MTTMSMPLSSRDELEILPNVRSDETLVTAKLCAPKARNDADLAKNGMTLTNNIHLQTGPTSLAINTRRAMMARAHSVQSKVCFRNLKTLTI